MIGGFQEDTQAFTVTLGSGDATLVDSYYTSPVLVSYASLTGDLEQTVLALQDPSSGQASLNAFQYDLNGCEDQVSWSRQYYLDQPQLNKILNRVWLLYEVTPGVRNLRMFASVFSPDGELSVAPSFTPGQGDFGQLAIGVYSFEITGSCITLSWLLPASEGNISLTGWIVKGDLGGEVIEGT